MKCIIKPKPFPPPKAADPENGTSTYTKSREGLHLVVTAWRIRSKQIILGANSVDELDEFLNEMRVELLGSEKVKIHRELFAHVVMRSDLSVKK